VAKRVDSFSVEAVREFVRDRVRLHGSAAAYGATVGVSRQFVTDVTEGRRTLGPRLLADLGLVKDATSYVRSAR
jgi:hypothetical protein